VRPGPVFAYLIPGLLLVCALFFSGVPSFAGQILGVEDSETKGKGRAELEFNVELSKEGKDREYSIINVLTLGVAEPLDFSIEYTYTFLDPQDGESVNGFEDTELFLKYSLPFGGAFFTQAVMEIGAIVPTGDEEKGTGDGAKDYEAGFVFGREIDTTQLFVNLAYIFSGDRPDGANPDDIFRASLALEQELNEKKGITAVAEIEYETAEFPGERDIVTVLGGFEYGLSEDVDLSFGVETALSGDGPDVQFTSGVTIEY
jgi:hypothetical protein